MLARPIVKCGPGTGVGRDLAGDQGLLPTWLVWKPERGSCSPGWREWRSGLLIGSLLTSYSLAKPAFPEQVPGAGEAGVELSVSPPFWTPSYSFL